MCGLLHNGKCMTLVAPINRVWPGMTPDPLILTTLCEGAGPPRYSFIMKRIIRDTVKRACALIRIFIAFS